MRIRLSQLRRIIKEEVQRTLNEAYNSDDLHAVYQEKTSDPQYGGCYLEDFEGVVEDTETLRADPMFTSEYQLIGDRVIAKGDFRSGTRYPDDRRARMF